MYTKEMAAGLDELRPGPKAFYRCLWCGVVAIVLSVFCSGQLAAQPVLVNDTGRCYSFMDAGNLRREGLSDLAFSTNGTAWIAASDGLHRYDGYRWSLFGTNYGFPSRFVRTVTVNEQGVLWVGTDKGAGVFDGQRFTLAAPTNRLAGPSVRRIKFPSDGSVWFCSDRWPDPNLTGGLTEFRNGQWRIYRKQDGLPSDHVYNFFQDSRGRRFALTDGGVAQQEGDRWRTVIDEPLWDMIESPDTGVCGFTGTKQYYLQGDTWKVRVYPKAVRNNHPPKGICVTSRGDILGYGFGRWTGEGFKSAGPINVSDLNPEAIREAPDRALWCIDRDQLMRWERYPRGWMEYTNLPAPRFNLASNEVIFAGPYAAYRRQGNSFVEVPELIGDPQCMEMDREEGIWSWTSNAVHYFTGERKSFAASEVGLAQIEGQVKDGQDALWYYGTQTNGRRAIACYSDRRWQTKVLPELQNRTITDASGDPDSGIWFTAEDRVGRTLFIHANLGRIEVRNWRSRSDTRAGLHVMVDRETNMWAYGDWGLYCAPRLEENRWQRIEKMDATMVVQALADRTGAWFVFSGVYGGQSGFGCYRQGRWSQVIAPVPLFMEHSGAGNRPVCSRARCYPDGTFCFGSYNSIYIVPQGRIPAVRRIALPEGKSMPDSILVDSSGVIWMEAQRSDTLPCVLAYHSDGIPPSTRITVSPAQVPLNGIWQVKVQGLERFALDSERKEFQFTWRIDDQAWSPLEAFPSDGLVTRGLSPGSHRFQVRACDEGQDVQPDATEATFLVLSPPWQEQTWFKVAMWMGAGVILALTMVNIERARKLARVNASLTAEVAVRRRTETELQQAQTELQRANQQLETRVQERTHELAIANSALRDEIAERQRIEAEQRALEAKMQQTQKLESLGVLAGGIAHDFNNMLTTILGNASLALMDLPPGLASREYLEEIVNSSRRAAELCGQMLAYSGRGRFVVELVDLSVLVRDTAHMLELSVAKKAPIEMRLAENLSRVEADATQLRQVIMNLVINAAEAIDGKDGVITVSTRITRCDRACLDATLSPDVLPEGEYVTLEVRDTGCGMDPATQAKIFDPFFTTKFTGRGLGLAAVLGIVRGHHGAVRVKSTPGEGTTFTILLPPTQAIYGPAPLPHASAVAAKPLEQKGTILLVDDELPVRNVAARLLERLGFRVLPAKDGIEAVTLFREHAARVDCVLLDLTMPGLDGIATFHELQQIRPDVRAVLASGYSEQELGRQFAQDGLAAILQKPYTIGALTATLARVLGTASIDAPKAR